MRRGLIVAAVLAVAWLGTCVARNWSQVGGPFEGSACVTGDGRRVGLLTEAGLMVIDAQSGAVQSREERSGDDAVVLCEQARVTQVELERQIARKDSQWNWDRRGPALFDHSPARAGRGTHLASWVEIEAKGGGRHARGGGLSPLRTLLQLRGSSGPIREEVLPAGEVFLDVDQNGRALVGASGERLEWLDLRTGSRHRAALAGPCLLPDRLSASGARAVWLCGETIAITDSSLAHPLVERQLPAAGTPGLAVISPDGRRAYVERGRAFPRGVLFAVRDDGTVLFEVELAERAFVLIPLPERDVVIMQDGEVARLSDDAGRELWRAGPAPR